MHKHINFEAFARVCTCVRVLHDSVFVWACICECVYAYVYTCVREFVCVRIVKCERVCVCMSRLKCLSECFL